MSAENETKSQGSMEKEQVSSEHDDLQKPMKEIDLLAYHEHNAGRLVVDPEYVLCGVSRNLGGGSS